ncbi:hypothetical protein [Chryseobacterium sp. EO14]|nr:hypothetical protein [Chryseobacterium sp. EO14]MCQ4139215.1 hypothetical protein [Chryseobacterium sp. EO14]
MRSYRFIVRTKTHSFSFIIEAENEKEAIQKGYDLHGDFATVATVVELKK